MVVVLLMFFFFCLGVVWGDRWMVIGVGSVFVLLDCVRLVGRLVWLVVLLVDGLVLGDGLVSDRLVVRLVVIMIRFVVVFW